MAFTLPGLPYAKSALEPHISAETLEYHHDKHHAAYVNKLNGLVAGTNMASKSLEELIKTASGGVFNNAAQVYNHTFYFNCMSPIKQSPLPVTTAQLSKDFGGFESFKKMYTEKSLGHFGSGWIWLALDAPTKKLQIFEGHDADSPIRTNNLHPILCIDLWEHAYYIDARNNRAQYVDAWYNVINWEFVEENMKKALSAS